MSGLENDEVLGKLLTTWRLVEELGLRTSVADRREKGDGTTILSPRQVNVCEGKKTVRVCKLQRRKVLRAYCRKRGITATPQLSSRLVNFCQRRNDRIYIVVQSLTVLLYLALDGDVSKLCSIESIILWSLHKILEIGTDAFTKLWKKATTAIANELQDNVLEQATRRNSLDKEEMEVYDMLMEAYGCPVRLEPEIKEFRFFSYISQSRFLPLPSMRATQEKLVDYINGLLKEKTVEGVEKAYDAGLIISENITQMASKQSKTLFQRTHLNLSNGSCWEASRSDLGKWHIMLPQSELVEFMNTPIGNYFEISEGYIYDMYGNTLCSAEYASSPIYKIAYLEEEMDGDLGQVYTIHESLGIQFDK
jgi:hypothetical protein